MEKVIYKTDTEVHGYWLITEAAIKELDSILESSWSDISEVVSMRIEKELRDKKEELATYEKDSNLLEQRLEEHKNYLLTSWQGRKNKKIEIEIGKIKRVSINSLSDAMKNMTFEKELPTGIDIELKTDDIDVSLSVDKKYNTLRLRVTPDDKELSRKVFSDLNDWVKRYKPKKWEQIWNSLYGVQWFIFPIFILILAFLATRHQSSYRGESIKKAHALLENGLDKSEISQALEILLSLETKYAPVQTVATIPSWFGYAAWGILFITVATSFKPKFDIAIGKGKTRVYFWKWWVKLISISIPTFLFSTMLLPKILEYLKIL